MHEGGDRRGIFLLRVQAWDPDDEPPARVRGDNWNDARGSLARCAPDRRHRSRPGREALRRRLAGRVRAIDRDRRAGSGRDRRDHRSQRAARAQRDDRRRGPCALSGSAGASSASAQPVLYLARRGGDSSFLPFDERGPHARSVALRRRRRGKQCRSRRARGVSVLRSRHLSARRGDPRGCHRSQPGLERQLRRRAAAARNHRSARHRDAPRDVRAGCGRLR